MRPLLQHQLGPKLVQHGGSFRLNQDVKFRYCCSCSPALLTHPTPLCVWQYRSPHAGDCVLSMSDPALKLVMGCVPQPCSFEQSATLDPDLLEAFGARAV